MRYKHILFSFFLIIGMNTLLHAQQDTLIIGNGKPEYKQHAKGDSAFAKEIKSDSVKHKKHIPRKATIRSAILPGWGQAYNRKYWKIPIVYAALGVTAAIFSYNLKTYKDINFAYMTLVNNDTANYPNVKPEYQPFVKANDQNSLFNYRSEFRRNIDYSVLFFILFWGLNVVDATVDAHLRDFNVNSDLSLKLKPTYNMSSNTSGLSLVFDIHKGKEKMRMLPQDR